MTTFVGVKAQIIILAHIFSVLNLLKTWSFWSHELNTRCKQNTPCRSDIGRYVEITWWFWTITRARIFYFTVNEHCIFKTLINDNFGWNKTSKTNFWLVYSLVWIYEASAIFKSWLNTWCERITSRLWQYQKYVEITWSIDQLGARILNRERRLHFKYV